MIKTGHPTFARSHRALLVVGIAAAVATLSGCSTGPKRPPLPDMTRLVAVNQQMPPELMRYRDSGHHFAPAPAPAPAPARPRVDIDTSGFSLGLSELPDVGGVSLQALAAAAASASFNTAAEGGREPQETGIGPRIWLYDGIDAEPIAAAVAMAMPRQEGISVEPLLSAAESETVGPGNPPAGEGERWDSNAMAAAEERLRHELEVAIEAESVAPPVVDESGALFLSGAIEAAEAAAGAVSTELPAVDESGALALVEAIEASKAEPLPTWVLHRGPFRRQALEWGDSDPTWTVHWLAPYDPTVSVDEHIFSGPLDEVLIEAVTALALGGAPIRIERARANHQLIIRSRE